MLITRTWRRINLINMSNWGIFWIGLFTYLIVDSICVAYQNRNVVGYVKPDKESERESERIPGEYER